jgi:hypothetical protein
MQLDNVMDEAKTHSPTETSLKEATSTVNVKALECIVGKLEHGMLVIMATTCDMVKEQCFTRMDRITRVNLLKESVMEMVCLFMLIVMCMMVVGKMI